MNTPNRNGSDYRRDTRQYDVNELTRRLSEIDVPKPNFDDAFEELDFYWTSQRFMELAPPTPSTPCCSRTSKFWRVNSPECSGLPLSKSAPAEKDDLNRRQFAHIERIQLDTPPRRNVTLPHSCFGSVGDQRPMSKSYEDPALLNCSTESDRSTTELTPFHPGLSLVQRDQMRAFYANRGHTNTPHNTPTHKKIPPARVPVLMPRRCRSIAIRDPLTGKPVYVNEYCDSGVFESNVHHPELNNQRRIMRERKEHSESFSSSKSDEGKKCGYCVNMGNDGAYNHTKQECPLLAQLQPCQLCGATGENNHTAMHCPMREPVYLKLSRVQHRKWIGCPPPRVCRKGEYQTDEQPQPHMWDPLGYLEVGHFRLQDINQNYLAN